MARASRSTTRKGTDMNEDINEVLAALAAQGADGQIVVNIFYVQHQYLTLPELSETIRPATTANDDVVKVPKSKSAKERDLGVWKDVKDPDHVCRAARFIIARELCETDHLAIPKDLAYDAYERHPELCVAASKANHKLRKKKVNKVQISRPSYWDAAFAYAVLDGLATLEQVVQFAEWWSSTAWTLDSVGVVKHDLKSTIRAFNASLEVFLQRSSRQFS